MLGGYHSARNISYACHIKSGICIPSLRYVFCRAFLLGRVPWKWTLRKRVGCRSFIGGGGFGEIQLLGSGGGRNGEKGMLTSNSAEASTDPGDSNMLSRWGHWFKWSLLHTSSPNLIGLLPQNSLVSLHSKMVVLNHGFIFESCKATFFKTQRHAQSTPQTN